MQSQTRAALHAILRVIKDATERITRDTNDTIANGNHVELVHLFAEFRDLREEIKAAAKSLEALEVHLSRVDIPDSFRNVHIKSTTIEGLGRVSIGHLWGCSMLDKEACMNWLRDTGNEGLIIETVNASSLAAFAKNRTEVEGKEMPPELFKTSITAYTSITKG